MHGQQNNKIHETIVQKLRAFFLTYA